MAVRVGQEMIDKNPGHNGARPFMKSYYRHSSIYAVKWGHVKKAAESKNFVYQGYLVVLKWRKIG